MQQMLEKGQNIGQRRQGHHGAAQQQLRGADKADAE